MKLIDADDLIKHKFTTQRCNGVEIEDINVVPVAVIINAQEITPEKALINKLNGGTL